MHAGQLGRTLNLFLRRARIPQRNIVGQLSENKNGV
jgi:hypothetical protein